MKIKILLILLMFCLIVIPALADDNESYVTTNIGITKEYWEGDGNVTSFNITFDDYFTDLQEIVLYCNRDSDGDYKSDDDWDSLDWTDEDCDDCNDDWKIKKIENEYFTEVRIDKVYGGGIFFEISNLTESIYNLSATTVESLQLTTKLSESERNLGTCTGSYDGCKIRSEEFENSTNYYKELFENTSSVCRGTEADLSTCENTLSTKTTSLSKCEEDLRISNESKTTIGFIWFIIGVVAGYLLFGRRKEAVPPEFAQFPESTP